MVLWASMGFIIMLNFQPIEELTGTVDSDDEITGTIESDIELTGTAVFDEEITGSV